MATSKSASTATGGSAFSSSAAAIAGLDKASAQFGQSIAEAFAKGAAQGKSFDSVLASVGAKLLELTAKTAVPSLGALFSGAVGGVGGSGLGAQPFAEGGVVSAPSYFPTSTGPALAGEAGPEAILPLARGADGKLGIAGAGGTTVNVTIAAQDVESFRRSEAQVAAALARAVARGRRAS